ncbi:hypothetical protein [Candidatus Babela massiliensis]|uniref:Uncharacterized protein n=1 Tax=Candidatus Babela massiliensis TaxID=673862 RepID=V6DH75_9BACT|nr:hypothetical protein [Candidatus Babela massiliensis]CDK30947.1 hypothetical protein BABL1_gene_81 [Candidatus Babela massiliensis]
MKNKKALVMMIFLISNNILLRAGMVSDYFVYYGKCFVKNQAKFACSKVYQNLEYNFNSLYDYALNNKKDTFIACIALYLTYKFYKKCISDKTKEKKSESIDINQVLK